VGQPAGGESYHRFWETPADLTLGPLALHETLRGSSITG